jgi:hypothetical protein
VKEKDGAVICITKEQREKWFVDRGLDGTDVGLVKHFHKKRAFDLPLASGRRTYIAHRIAAAVEDRPTFLWVCLAGTFESAENMNLFERVRASCGEYRPLHEATGHLFSPGEGAILECILDCVFYFYWDAWLLDDTVESGIYVDHHDSLVLCDHHPTAEGRWGELADSLHLEPE